MGEGEEIPSLYDPDHITIPDPRQVDPLKYTKTFNTTLERITVSRTMLLSLCPGLAEKNKPAIKALRHTSTWLHAASQFNQGNMFHIPPGTSIKASQTNARALKCKTTANKLIPIWWAFYEGQQLARTNSYKIADRSCSKATDTTQWLKQFFGDYDEYHLATMTVEPHELEKMVLSRARAHMNCTFESTIKTDDGVLLPSVMAHIIQTARGTPNSSAEPVNWHGEPMIEDVPKDLIRPKEWWGDSMLQFKEEKPEEEMEKYAICIPCGEGKSWLTQHHKHLFADHDDLVKLEKLELLRITAQETGNWETINSYLRTAEIPPNKILLTWHPNTCPPGVKVIGAIMLESPPTDIPERKISINKMARRDLSLVSTLPIAHVVNRAAVEMKALQWAQELQRGELSAEMYAGWHDVEFYQTLTFKNPEIIKITDTEDYESEITAEYIPIESIDTSYSLEGEDDEPNPLWIQEMWDNTDLTDLVRAFMPKTKLDKPTTTWANPWAIRQDNWYTTHQAPNVSRPMVANMYNVENAAAIRMGDIVTMRKHPLVVEEEITRIRKYCLRADVAAQQSTWSVIGLESLGTSKWLSKRTGWKQIKEDLAKMLAEGPAMHPLNDVNVHPKKESRAKQSTWEGLQVRIIVWQAKEIAAIFAPAFLLAKNRLKAVLKDRIIYADGLTPPEITNLLGRIRSDGLYYMEDDLNKQDQQTDDPILDVEMAFYVSILKMDANLVSLWRWCHHEWRYKGETMRGYSHGMRQTGQVTTAIGNVITNLIVHSRLVQELGKDLELMLVLGDDNLILARRSADATKQRKICKDYYNMTCDFLVRRDAGVFLRMVVGPNGHGGCQAGPDFWRLRNRFEVLNNSKWQELEARCQSYCLMLGKCDATDAIIKARNWTIAAPKWYNVQQQIFNVASAYDLTYEWSLMEFRRLSNYIASPKLYAKQFLVYASQADNKEMKKQKRETATHDLTPKWFKRP
jgi:hypothetical protein